MMSYVCRRCGQNDRVREVNKITMVKPIVLDNSDPFATSWSKVGSEEADGVPFGWSSIDGEIFDDAAEREGWECECDPGQTFALSLAEVVEWREGS